MSGKNRSISDYYLLPGHIHLPRDPCLISTVLGSCVAVSLWDSCGKFGGVTHFLYPFTADRRESTAEYGNVAMRHFIKMMLTEGARVQDLKAQIFGGAISSAADCIRIARENLQIARMILRRYRIDIVSEDTGGYMGRKVVYNTGSNEAIVYKVNTIRQADWYPYMHGGE